MADYWITVINIQPHERTEYWVTRGLKDETMELPDYGEVAEIIFSDDKSSARVRMTGGTDEVAAAMSERVLPGLDVEY